MTRILPNIITLIAISIFQESLGYYSVCDVVFAAKILSQKTHRWRVSAYKYKVKVLEQAKTFILQELCPANRTSTQPHWLSFAAQGELLDREMYILVHIWFYYLAAQLL